MKIHLKNLCCWEDNVFEFPDVGNILISAISGKGKTSIIRGILFALFGTGQRIILDGKRKCSVELWIKDLHIKRTKGPCHLIVNGVLEDKEAQAYINERYKYKFMYLSQDGDTGFVNMNPMDKLSFLEQIIFEKVNIADIKENIKNKIKLYETEISSSKIQLSSVQEILTDIHIPTIPNGGIPTNNINIDILKKKHASLVKNFESYRQYKEQKQLVDKQIEYITSLLVDDDIIKEELNINKQKYDEYTVFRKFFKMKKIKREGDMLLEKIRKIEHEFNGVDIEDAIKSLRVKLKESREQQQYKQHYCDIRREYQKINLKVKQFSIQSIETSLKKYYRLRCKKYECPKCQTKLELKDNQLIFITEDIIEDIPEDLEERIKKLESDRQQYVFLNTRLEDLKNEQLEVDKLIKDKNKEEPIKCYEQKLEHFITQEALFNDYYEKYCILEKEYQKNKVESDLDIPKDISVESVEKELQTLHRNIVLLENQLAMNQKYITQLNEISIPCEPVGIEDVDPEQIKMLEQEIQDVIEYNKYIDAKKMYDKYKNQETLCIEKIHHNEKQLSHVLTFKEKVLESEAIAMTNIINTINSHVQPYLDRFFQEPLQAYIATSKQGKTGVKTTISIMISQKGKPVEFNLSGGESDRVMLAFTLAIAEIIGTPILLLDECVKSLDQDNAYNVFSVLNEFCKNRLVITIAHQVVKGIFDDILYLD